MILRSRAWYSTVIPGETGLGSSPVCPGEIKRNVHFAVTFATQSGFLEILFNNKKDH